MRGQLLLQPSAAHAGLGNLLLQVGAQQAGAGARDCQATRRQGDQQQRLDGKARMYAGRHCWVRAYGI